ncbi:hypothetical protein B0H13DRAFT_2549567, partial [Mycena leptocephala]
MTADTEETACRSFLRLHDAGPPCNGVVVPWLVTKLKKQATRRYSKAISRSVECDDRVLIFASHATDLTRALNEDYPYNEVIAFTNIMKREIRHGFRAAESNKFDFISVRTSLELLRIVAYPNACKAEGCNKTGVSLRHISLNALALWFGRRRTGDCFTESQPLKDMINDLIDCIDALVKKAGCDWSLVGQELARLQSDIVVHKSTLSDVQAPERWASMARECQTHVSDLRKLQDFYPSGDQKPNSIAMSQPLPFDDVSDMGDGFDSTSSAGHPEPPPSHVVAVGVQELVDSAVNAFVLLEPWCLAESRKGTHRIIRGMMAHLKKQAHRYFEAIDMSIGCSDQGIVFSEHAIDLCRALEAKMSAAEILKFITRMETEVSRAQKDVEKTRARFSDVRGELVKESERIPRRKGVVERDEQAAQRAVGTWGIPERWATWIIEHSVLDDGAKTAIAAIGAVLSALPHVGIILPIAIPAAIIAARITAEGVKVVADFAIDNRKKHIVNCRDALLGLEDIEEKIALVIKSVNNFATWWQKMSCDLQDIKAQVISKGDIHEIVAQIRHQLVCLGGPFRAYSSQVRKLQDFYPASYDAPRKAPIDS